MKIVSLNINGIKTHWHKLKNLMEIEKNWNIMCVQETHRGDKNKIQNWGEKNNLQYYPNHIDRDEIWIDKEEKKRLYFKGTGIFLKKELERHYTIKSEIVQEHRIQVLELKNRETGQKVNVYNVYGPPDVGRWQTKVYLTLTNHIEKEPDNAVVCGDFNIVTDRLDSKNITNFKLTPAAKNWKAFTNIHKIRDVWRWRNPHKKLYTVTKTFQARRIDRVYAAGRLLPHITKCTYDINTISDHTFLAKMTVQEPEDTRWGHGVWKNDARNYEDEGLQTEIEKLYKKAKKTNISTMIYTNGGTTPKIRSRPT